MAYKIVFTEDALIDLQIILEFIRADDPDAAERFGAALLDHIEILAIFPLLGVSLPRRPGRIEILHLWHAARRELGDLC